MLKVNLIPIKEKKKRKEIFIITCSVLVFILVVLAMFYVYVTRMGIVNDLNNQIAEVQKESDDYQDKINAFKDLQNKEQSLQAFQKTVKSISETQRKVIVAVDQLAVNLPEGIWFTGITQGKGSDSNKFTLQGYAFSQLSLEKYCKVLQRPGSLLSNATYDVKNISASVGNNKQIQQFEISVKVPDLSS